VERRVAQPLNQKERFDSNQNEQLRWLRKTVENLTVAAQTTLAAAAL